MSAHRQTHAHTHTHTHVKTVYPPVSLRSLGGYNNNNNQDNVYGAIIVLAVLPEFTRFMCNADSASGGRQHSDQANRLGL